MRKTRLAINGLGRIGKNICRIITQDLQEHFDIVGANDLLPVETLAQSLRRDSVHGRFPVDVQVLDENTLQIGQNKTTIFTEREAKNIGWGDLDVDVVLECSRFYLTSEKASAHLEAGAKKVIISAPPKDNTPIYVVGVNTDTINEDYRIISNASCTTNCLAPITKALDDAFGVISGLMSTTHAATSEQSLVDTIGSAKTRSALNNIIPTSTGAARAIGKVIPHLEGQLNGTALRVPVDDGSVLEAVFVIKGNNTVNDIHAALQAQANQQNEASLSKSILYIGDEYEVSADSIGAKWSSMVLAQNTQVIPFDGYTQVKLTAFYDNEIGYAYRMADLARLMMA
ncbi:MAG: glyceraldehyde 3-phosphate dehydrogenase NAD-binding domain-containing protein [Chloroflexota bacterium]